MKTCILNLLLEYIFSLIFTREFVVVCARVGGANTTLFTMAHFAKQKILNRFLLPQNMNFGGEFLKSEIPSPKPARIPPQTPPAGGKRVEAGRILSPRQIASPCRVRFNHLDFSRNSFELCPTNTAKFI